MQDARNAGTTGVGENRRKIHNSNILMQFGICERHRPSQPPQGDDLVLLFFAQDIAPLDGGPIPRRGQCPESAPLAGFQVTLNGRFWVTPEAAASWLSRFHAVVVDFCDAPPLQEKI